MEGFSVLYLEYRLLSLTIYSLLYSLYTAGVDFLYTNTKLTFFPAVFASPTIQISIINDNIDEPTEYFGVGLVAGPRVVIGEVASACVRIVDGGKHFYMFLFISIF